MFCSSTRNTVLAAIVVLCVCAVAASGQNQSESPQTAEVRDGVYWVKGGNGANTTFIVGNDEVVVIDAKTTAAAAEAMLAEIKKVTTLPVKHVILTHSDGDHVGGLTGFPKGLPIIAHANAKRDMEESAADPRSSGLRDYLPTDVVTDDREMTLGGVRVNLHYFGPAHTDGDLVIHLPDQKIAVVGDLVFLAREPLIHRHKNGTSTGLIRVLKGIVALDADTFISGHNDIISKERLRQYLAEVEEKQAKIKSMMDEGKSLEEIKSAMGVPDAPAQGYQRRRRQGLTEIMYEDLLKQK